LWEAWYVWLIRPVELNGQWICRYLLKAGAPHQSSLSPPYTILDPPHYAPCPHKYTPNPQISSHTSCFPLLPPSKHHIPPIHTSAYINPHLLPCLSIALHQGCPHFFSMGATFKIGWGASGLNGGYIYTNRAA